MRSANCDLLNVHDLAVRTDLFEVRAIRVGAIAQLTFVVLARAVDGVRNFHAHEPNSRGKPPGLGGRGEGERCRRRFRRGDDGNDSRQKNRGDDAKPVPIGFIVHAVNCTKSFMKSEQIVL
jgi:hypothetical protein